MRLSGLAENAATSRFSQIATRRQEDGKQQCELPSWWLWWVNYGFSSEAAWLCVPALVSAFATVVIVCLYPWLCSRTSCGQVRGVCFYSTLLLWCVTTLPTTCLFFGCDLVRLRKQRKDLSFFFSSSSLNVAEIWGTKISYSSLAVDWWEKYRSNVVWRTNPTQNLLQIFCKKGPKVQIKVSIKIHPSIING